jgi:hypothetical protein
MRLLSWIVPVTRSATALVGGSTEVAAIDLGPGSSASATPSFHGCSRDINGMVAAVITGLVHGVITTIPANEARCARARPTTCPLMRVRYAG